MLTVQGLSAGVLQNVSLTLPDKSCVAIVGASGSGKTTLLNAIVGVIPYQGTICLEGKSIDNLKAWQRPCRYLNQQLHLFPHLTIDNNLRLAQYGAKLPQDKQARRKLLDYFEIGALAERYPWQISGGEQQRAAFARALVAKPQLLLLDEPFSHLDWPMRARLWRLLNELREELALSILLVTHEPKEAKTLAQGCLTLEKGILVSEV